jgi:hypothetical protein
MTGHMSLPAGRWPAIAAAAWRDRRGWCSTCVPLIPFPTGIQSNRNSRRREKNRRRRSNNKESSNQAVEGDHAMYPRTHAIRRHATPSWYRLSQFLGSETDPRRWSCWLYRSCSEAVWSVPRADTETTSGYWITVGCHRGGQRRRVDDRDPDRQRGQFAGCGDHERGAGRLRPGVTAPIIEGGPPPNWWQQAGGPFGVVTRVVGRQPFKASPDSRGWRVPGRR